MYDYKAYESKKTGLFYVTTDNYELPGGWVQREEEKEIIGECDLFYVTRLLPSSHGEWVGDSVIEHSYIVPVGVHKSRLIRWVDTQLNLF